jgi:hypothetical protein
MSCSLLRSPRRFAGALLLLAALTGQAAQATPALQAQEPPPAPPAGSAIDPWSDPGASTAAGPARFLIEAVAVEGAKETLARIVAAETLLDEGGTYTEADLRQAVARVHRLPFVVDATFALRKGSERGAYVLVIRVEPARWFFFEHQSQVSWTNFSAGRQPEQNGSFDTQTGLIGARAFLGRSGVLFGSTGYRDDMETASTQIGYTQYDLFGRGVVATAFFSSDYSCCGVVGDEVIFDSDRKRSQLGLNLAIPLSRFQALQLDWTEQRDEVDLSGFLDVGPEVDLAGRTVELRWVRDTSDDPLLPRQGSVFSAGLEYRHQDSFAFDSFPVQDLDLFDIESTTADVTATRHWPLTARQSVSAGGRVFFEQVEVDGAVFLRPERERVGGSISARHLFRLWTLREPGNLGDLYLETGASFGQNHISQDAGFLFGDTLRLELSTALIYRSQWGRVRLNFAYVGEEAR